MNNDQVAYFSPSLRMFIPKAWKSDGTYSNDSWPKDSILVDKSVSDTFWKVNPPAGKVLGSSNGLPAWADAPSTPSPTTKEIERLRLIAYANPLTGSDRLFSEAERMQIMDEDGSEEIKSKAVARYKEIQAQYPWPAN